MNKQRELCPWCHQEVWVEPAQRRLYRCPSCSQTFTFTPASGQPVGQGKPASNADAPGLPRAQPPDQGAPPPGEYVETPFLKELLQRVLAYLRDGLPVHLTGPAGCGKTTLALQVASQLGHPVVLIHGDDEMGTADLVGKESGYQRSYTRDQYVHTVVKVEEEAKPMWVGRALTQACQQGYTVVYDEFTRSRPEANNVLLSVLEERVLPLRGGHTPVHPNFRIIFTSNPAEYAGVHGAQDALLDRMVTIRLEGLDRDTEIAIAVARSGLSRAEVERIFDVVHAFREAKLQASISSVRPSLMIARILKVRGGHANADDAVFAQACRDVLFSEVRRSGPGPISDQQLEESLLHLIHRVCTSPLPPEVSRSAQRPDDLIAELMRDREVEELLLKKLREKGLGSRFGSGSPPASVDPDPQIGR